MRAMAGAPMRAARRHRRRERGDPRVLAAGLVEVDPIVRAISACFVAVYVAATAAGVRLLDGRRRGAAALSLALVVGACSPSPGPYVAAPAAVALAARAFVSARPGGAACQRRPAAAMDLRLDGRVSECG